MPTHLHLKHVATSSSLLIFIQILASHSCTMLRINHLMYSFFCRQLKYLTHGCSTVCGWMRKMDGQRCTTETTPRKKTGNIYICCKLLVLELTLPDGLDWVFEHAFYSITVLKRDMGGKWKRKNKALAITLKNSDLLTLCLSSDVGSTPQGPRYKNHEDLWEGDNCHGIISSQREKCDII